MSAPVAKLAPLGAPPPTPEVALLSSRVIAVCGRNASPATLDGSKVYVVGRGAVRTLIDTGSGGDRVVPNLKCAREAVGSDFTIGRVVLTHWHLDHSGGVDEVLKQEGLSQSDVVKIGRPTASSDGAAGDRLGASPAWEAAAAAEAGNAVRGEDATEQDERMVRSGWAAMRHGDVIAVDDETSLEVIHTPGHAWDHACLLLREEGSLFSGDMVLGAGSTVFYDLSAFMSSLRLLRRELTQAVAKVGRSGQGQGQGVGLLYPGHGPGGGSAMAALDDNIAHREARISQVAAALVETEGSEGARKVLDAAEGEGKVGHWNLVGRITDHVYGDLPSPMQVVMAQRNVAGVLVHLRQTRSGAKCAM